MNLSAMKTPRVRRTTGKLLFVALIATVFSSPGFASDSDEEVKTCYVDKIKYSNHGGYTVAGLNLKYRKSNGDKWGYDYPYYSSLNKDINKGGSLSVDLNHFNGMKGEGTVVGTNYPPMREGDEVWIQVAISMGETKSCRKDAHKLVYRKDVNKTMKFKSSGTTLNNNRCKVDGNMDDMCYTGE